MLLSYDSWVCHETESAACQLHDTEIEWLQASIGISHQSHWSPFVCDVCGGEMGGGGGGGGLGEAEVQADPLALFNVDGMA